MQSIGEGGSVITPEATLARIRGAMPPQAHNARTIAALTSNPGCHRRAVTDAAGVDRQRLADDAGYPMPSGQSQFAITRGNAFERQLKANGYAELIQLLSLPIAEVSCSDTEETGTLAARHARTRQMISRSVTDAIDTVTVFDHPLLRIDVGGRPAYLEPDLLAFRLAGQFHVVEIKSFAVIDGQADGAKVAAAVNQCAVYVLALRELLADLGHGPEHVADEVILVYPENFSNRPTAVWIDVRKQLTVLRRQLSRLNRVNGLLAGIKGEDPLEMVRAIPHRYAPPCLDACDLAYLCRAESRDDTASLGRSVRDDLGGIDSVTAALDIAAGTREPTPDQAEAAELLRTAHKLRRECLS